MKKIPAAEPLIKGRELEYVEDAVKSTWLSNGKYVELFEKEFARFCGTKYAASVVNGTAALHLLLASLGITKDDEVIVPDFTFVATANAVSYTGAKPIFVDVDRNTWNIDPERIKEKITKNTKAIIAVDLYGYPADMDRINSIAKSNDILVIEDACEAIGAIYKGKKAGALSLAGCFSFYGNKTITTGEGGMIVSDDKSLIDRCNYLKSHAQVSKGVFRHTEIGFNYRFTNIQAAVGLGQLENIDYILNKKKENAQMYYSLLKDLDILMFPSDGSSIENSYWMYSIVFKKDGFRDKLMKVLSENGVETRPFFEPMHTLPMYKTKEAFPNSEFLARNGLNLPSSATLFSKDADYICEIIKKFIRSSS